jgi:hypothetical protein
MGFNIEGRKSMPISPELLEMSSGLSEMPVKGDDQ